ncbi:MAG: hypothetical protein A3C30_04080 [Candidatus Levybacteria bacterium RIFCSPHIGHO2_02_FULL_40_18]|nr:MAG: hypothetical protein A2869_01355 [Candidatus Levybacteria bacterium RIFCSPHIGHO2_01_FULL_40_58]OGH26259.1 MAG: hypothetical protein A3C30_04080 [Candidatus Levybacteria bacterium RIFCSPHIGHO2_02_FULL_40_18]OGH31218.1 MAG: hypothetical protein A3E43_02335 [Candidatus Levybacteria bacterium RIFCSPHIGHO2_12_FULL_40_31]OGH39788.1 MAG: hypothetical protein A2894_02860 [Candidatus Levybacteria bacterium RIFCSPLOWO2_01_FULL_40_64]OGH49105.1 MAG: hypothetical protein A3I54_00865 [Candidatus Lev
MTKIGFDLDGVFISGPPFIPKFLIEWLYKQRRNSLLYRFPGKLEQKIRVLSHIPIFRPAIKNNLLFFKKTRLSNMYLISSRFSFLKQRTADWDKKNNLFGYFKKCYFNEKDEQPHKFKDSIIKKEKIKKYIDDDLDLLLFLSKENPNIEFYWVGPSTGSGEVRGKPAASGTRQRWTRNLPNNIKQIKDLAEFFTKYV